MTRLGDFSKFLVTNFNTKVAQIFGAILKGVTFYVKTAVVTFWGSLRGKLATFYFNIWSRLTGFVKIRLKA